MTSLTALAERRPLVFVLVLLACWIFAGAIVAILAGLLFGRETADPESQGVGTLVATLLVLSAAYRLGWYSRVGITSLGSPSSWIATVLLSVYVLLAGFYAFFGDTSFQVSSLLGDHASPILLQAVGAGFVEEVVFRGIILYSLVRVWGDRKRGIVAALIVQAVLLAIPHPLQLLAGVGLPSALSNVLATAVFGLWCGTLVLAAGSLWPAVFVHADANAFTLLKGLTTTWITPDYLGYLRGALFELPLVLLGLWIVVKCRKAKAKARRSGPNRSPAPSTSLEQTLRLRASPSSH